VVEARTAQRTLKLRREKVLEWLGDSIMHWSQNCVFIDGAVFNMHIRKNFSRSKKGMSVKAVAPSNRRVTATIIRVICEKDVVDLTLREQKKNSGTKIERGRVERLMRLRLNARVGTRSEHFMNY
ncbi:hypothetical protein BD560DRAFT_336290, partial [Blakeslea trispora]